MYHGYKPDYAYQANLDKCVVQLELMASIINSIKEGEATGNDLRVDKGVTLESFEERFNDFREEYKIISSNFSEIDRQPAKGLDPRQENYLSDCRTVRRPDGSTFQQNITQARDDIDGYLYSLSKKMHDYIDFATVLYPHVEVVPWRKALPAGSSPKASVPQGKQFIGKNVYINYYDSPLIENDIKKIEEDPKAAAIYRKYFQPDGTPIITHRFVDDYWPFESFVPITRFFQRGFSLSSSMMPRTNQRNNTILGNLPGKTPPPKIPLDEVRLVRRQLADLDKMKLSAGSAPRDFPSDRQDRSTVVDIRRSSSPKPPRFFPSEQQSQTLRPTSTVVDRQGSPLRVFPSEEQSQSSPRVFDERVQTLRRTPAVVGRASERPFILPQREAFHSGSEDEPPAKLAP